MKTEDVKKYADLVTAMSLDFKRDKIDSKIYTDNLFSIANILRKEILSESITAPPTSIETYFKTRNKSINDEYGWTGEFQLSVKDIMDLLIDLKWPV